jgi:threonine-phosphate decarboxylase|tara:strand:- start:6933 stop:8063 length:1131 start_codon:yes stop_codon:yes gene_type:complete
MTKKTALEKNRTARKEQYETLSTAHGGYWRYGFVDHAYLYNLHFPPERFYELLKDQIKELVLNYPVAQGQLARWVGDLISQPAERIVVGNGAAELIKIVSGHIAKKLIVPVPSFNEYANATPEGQVIEFPLDMPSFELDVDKFAAEALGCQADVAIVVSPNNPTSLLVPKADLIRLVNKLAEHDCMLIVDESFIDFANNRDQETLERDIALYPNLAIFKSMSKAYGICGLRIGYMLTDNMKFAEKVRSGIHIWNLNGFAETFLKMAPDYQEEFETSCALVRRERDDFYQALCSINGMVVYKPEANYIFCRLPEHSPTGPEVAEILFIEHNIYIKHCQGKSMPESERYIRVASRTPAENQSIVSALKIIVRSKAANS